MSKPQMAVNPPQRKLNFHVDDKNEILWIIHRKVAGSSIRKALGIQAMISAEEALPYNKDLHTITIVRHPWDRITSAAYNIFKGQRNAMPFGQRMQEEILSREGPHAVDWHFWPQSYVLDGFRVDEMEFYENLNSFWKYLQTGYELPDLPWVNKGDGHKWQDQDFDWSLLLPWYKNDFYAEWWEKT